jgi:hypothetical protein
MPKALFFWLITAAFLAWTIAAPYLAKYNTWLARGDPGWTKQNEEDMAVQFRVMGALGLLLSVALSVLATIAAVRG